MVQHRTELRGSISSRHDYNMIMDAMHVNYIDMSKCAHLPMDDAESKVHSKQGMRSRAIKTHCVNGFQNG